MALGRYDPARDAYTRARALTSAPAARADIERRMADVAVRLGEWDRAAAGLDAALALAGDDVPLTVRLLADRAVVAVRAGSTAEAAAFVASALELAGNAGRSVGNAGSSAGSVDAYVRDVAGIVALAGGAVGDAIEEFRAALSALDREPDLVLRAAVLNNLARAEADAGAVADAVATARAALELGRGLGDRHRTAALHANLADRLHEAGGPGSTEEAMAHLKESAALFAEVGADPLARPDVWTLTAW